MRNNTKNFKKLRKFAMGISLASLLFGSSAELQAQTVTTSLATGTGTTTSLPILGNYGFNYSQSIYLVSDMNPTAVGAPTLITKIRYFYVSGNLASSTNWTIFMGNTTQADFNSTTNWIPLANMSQVFTGDLTAPAGNNWLEITLDTPFLYDGTSNLVVAVDENTPGFSNVTWRSHTTGANRSMLYRSDSVNPDPASPPTATSRFGNVAQTQFEHAPTIACSGSPAVTTTLVNDDEICVGETVNFSFSGLPFNSGFTYQWQFNTTGTWTDIAGATEPTYSASLTETQNVRAVVTCSVSNESTPGNEITVTVNANPVVAVDVIETAFCAGTSVDIEASGAATYSWAPSAGLATTNTAVVSANPSVTTTYTVTGTNAAGCTATATSKIIPLTAISKEATFSPGENCEPGSPIAVTATVTPATISGGSSWEYRFLGNDGTTVLQDWNVSNVYNFIPTMDSVYSYFYQVRSNNCADYIDSSKIQIPVGFGADVAVTDYNCLNLGGIVNINNAFGQTETTVVYANPFDDVANTANVVFTGSAGIVNDKAILTPSATGQTGTMSIDLPNFQAGFNNSMTVKFKLTADQPINTFGTGGADGISYSFADDALATGVGPAHNGRGSKLRLSFDAAGNSPNQPGIYLVYGYNAAAPIAPANATTLAYSPNVSLWKIQEDVPVELTINALGQATVLVNNEVVFQNIQLPPSYLTEDVSNWKHFFGAVTGGDAMRQGISDFEITTGALNFALTPTTVAPTAWQFGTEFTDLLPGTYDVWLAKNETSSCAKLIETIEILNTNPLVNLGNDTTICAGESITLDAQNVGSSYVWSNSNVVTQTLTVNQSGTVVAYVTDALGCVGVGSIDIEVTELPTATSIYAQGNYPTVFFSVINAENVSAYAWNFGDGSTVANAPGSVSHTYEEDGTYTVTATISNACGSETLTQTVTIENTASLATNTIEGLKMYPNPTSNDFTVEIDNSKSASIEIYTVQGAWVESIPDFNGKTSVSASTWTKGIYFVHVTSEGKTSINKLIVQ